jgi:hypothetical protein
MAQPDASKSIDGVTVRPKPDRRKKPRYVRDSLAYRATKWVLQKGQGH